MSNSMNQFNHPVEYIQLQKDNYLFVDPRFNPEYSLQQLLKKLGDLPGTVILPDKPIVLTKPIHLKAGQSLRGVGHLSELRANNFAEPAITFSSYSNISNVRLTGNNVEGSQGIANTPNAANFRLSNVDVFAFRKGIVLRNCWVGFFDNVVVNWNDIGMEWSEFVNAVQFLGGHVGANRVGIRGLQGGMLLKNTISSTLEGNTESAIHISSSYSALTVRDCYFELNGNNAGFGGDVIIDSNNNNELAYGALIDGCFGLKSTPMIHLKGGKGTKVSGNTGWVKHFLKIEDGARDTFVDHNTYYTMADYDTCVGITDESDSTKYVGFTSKIMSMALASVSIPNKKMSIMAKKFNPDGNEPLMTNDKPSM